MNPPRIDRPIHDTDDVRRILQDLGRAIPSPLDSPTATHRRLLFLTQIGASDLFSLREGLLIHALRLRGASVTVVLCDGLPVCEARTADNDDPRMCEWCHPKGSRNLATLGIEERTLSSLVPAAVARRLWERALTTPADAIFTTSHRGIPLGKHVHASTLRYFRAGVYDAEDPAFGERARRDLGAALVQAEAAHAALAGGEYDKLVSNHAGYAAWGPWCDTAKELGIPYDVCAGGWRRNTLMCHHEAGNLLQCDDLWSDYRDRPLDGPETEELNTYLETRETNSADFNPFFEEVDRDLGALRSRLGIDRADWKRTLCAFTNVSWDAADFEQVGAFESMFEWVTALVRRMEAHPDTLLLIKAHPAERKFVEATPQHWRIADKTRAELGEPPANVHFIPPEDNVSNFALYGAIDGGLVNRSTVGLEMALAGVPVLMTGAPAHYSYPELVRLPRDRDDYLATLDRWIADGPDFTPDRELARRYAYTLWFRKPIPFEPLDVLQWDPKSIHVGRLAELAPGRFRGLDAICEGILNDAPFERGPLSRPGGFAD